MGILKYKRQRELQLKLNGRIPRGLRGSDQNQFRQLVAFFANQPRYTFEEAVELALFEIRQRKPGFIPRVQPVEKLPF
jgi:hypothetical protein